MTRKISILGATGSIGKSTLDLVERNRERFEVTAVTAATNVADLAEIAIKNKASLAVIADESGYQELAQRLEGTDCRAASGSSGLVDAALMGTDLVIAAIVGCAGLAPVMAAVKNGQTVALANKEALVTAGALMTRAAASSGSMLLPVDSEHNAIFQCLAGSKPKEVAKIILTASGGPFRTASAESIASATPAQAIAHPNWSMGAKISVDSATLMNKGLELIEAHYLFELPSAQIDVVIHPQSIIHSMVEFVDGSVLAHLGSADMRIPIAFALAWPDRIPTPAQKLDLPAIGRLDFELPDLDRFPALRLARDALELGGAAPIVLNAANEIAVAAFLDRKISFCQIATLVQEALSLAHYDTPVTIDDVMEIDGVTRESTRTMIKACCS